MSRAQAQGSRGPRALGRVRLSCPPDRRVRLRLAGRAPYVNLGSSDVRDRIRHERVVAGLRTEVVRPPLVLGGRRRVICIDPHPADGIRGHCHGVLLLPKLPCLSPYILPEWTYTKGPADAHEQPGSARWLRGADLGERSGLLGGRHAIGEVGSVFVDEPEKRGAPGMLPGQAEEVQAGDIGDASTVDNVAVVHHSWDLDPRIVGSETGRPDHYADIQGAAVGESDRAPVCVDQTGTEADARPPQLAPIGPDDQVRTGLHAAAESGVGRLPEKAESGEPPEQILPEQPLRQHWGVGAYRQVDPAGSSQ